MIFVCWLTSKPKTSNLFSKQELLDSISTLQVTKSLFSMFEYMIQKEMATDQFRLNSTRLSNVDRSILTLVPSSKKDGAKFKERWCQVQRKTIS